MLEELLAATLLDELEMGNAETLLSHPHRVPRFEGIPGRSVVTQSVIRQVVVGVVCGEFAEIGSINNVC